MSKIGKALIVGWTGETGKELINALSKSKLIEACTLAGRREVDLPEDIKQMSLFTQTIVDFDNFSKEAAEKHEHVFCVLGTTRGKSGKDGFIKVDKDYVINVANAAKTAGVRHFHLMTSTGSNKNSMFLYPKTKGEVEEHCEKLGFEKLTIYQPGLLLCDRVESRTGERIFQTMMKPLYNTFGASVGAIACSAVANAMVESAATGETGRLGNGKIQELSDVFTKRCTNA